MREKSGALKTWIVACCFVAVGVTIASPVAFKFVPDIADADPSVYFVSIPTDNFYTDLKSIFDHVSTSCGGSAANVTAFRADQTTCSWTGAHSCNQAFDPEGGFLVSVKTPGCSTWIVAGTEGRPDVTPHPTRTFPTADPDTFFPSLPLHTTALTGSELFAEIPNCYSVTRFAPDQTACAYTGPMSCDFPVTPGESYMISVTAPTVWAPEHY